MDISASIALFFTVMTVYILIIDIFTILFRMTGMTEEKAKFQVISLLINSGYSTRESEIVVSKMIRRKMARTVMLFGYVFSVTIITVFVNVVLALPQGLQTDLWKILVILMIIFIIFLIIKKIPRVKAWFNDAIVKLGRKWMFQDRGNMINVLDEYARGVVAGVELKYVPSELEGKTLGEIELPSKYGLHIIAIKRNAQMVDYITKDTDIKAGDELLLFGQLVNIIKLFAPETAKKDEEEQNEERRMNRAANEQLHREEREAIQIHREDDSEDNEQQKETDSSGDSPKQDENNHKDKDNDSN